VWVAGRDGLPLPAGRRPAWGRVGGRALSTGSRPAMRREARATGGTFFDDLRDIAGKTGTTDDKRQFRLRRWDCGAMDAAMHFDCRPATMENEGQLICAFAKTN
jgi:hypothetical protein